MITAQSASARARTRTRPNSNVQQPAAALCSDVRANRRALRCRNTLCNMCATCVQHACNMAYNVLRYAQRWRRTGRMNDGLCDVASRRMLLQHVVRCCCPSCDVAPRRMLLQHVTCDVATATLQHVVRCNVASRLCDVATRPLVAVLQRWLCVVTDGPNNGLAYLPETPTYFIPKQARLNRARPSPAGCDGPLCRSTPSTPSAGICGPAPTRHDGRHKQSAWPP